MYALAVQNLPVGDEWLYEVKFDGYRCLAGRDKDGITLWSRRGNLFTDQFSQIAKACGRLPAGTLLDGEIVAVDQNGHISFNLLQHHRSHAQALLFYAFDVLIYQGQSLLKVPLRDRRKVLSEIFDKMGKKAAPLGLSETLNGTPANLVRVAKEFGFEGILRNGRTRSTSPANAAAPGSSTASIKVRSS
jgi:bifunctional non-homologous end joining protein LigD